MLSRGQDPYAAILAEYGPVFLRAGGVTYTGQTSAVSGSVPKVSPIISGVVESEEYGSGTVEVGGPTDFRFLMETNSWTILLWADISSVINVKNLGIGTGLTSRINVGSGTTGRFTVERTNVDGVTSSWVTPSSLIDAGVPTMWTSVADIGERTSYKNTVEVVSAAALGAISAEADNETPLRIGSTGDGIQMFQGAQDAFMIFDRPLSAAEVSDIYARTAL